MPEHFKRGNSFTVVICAYNAGKYIEKCIDSVINQLSDIDELLIINDGSTDNTAALLKKYASADKLRILNNETNCGLAHSRNTGYLNASGSVVFYIDADTSLPDEMLDRIDSLFSEYTDYAAVTGRGIETVNSGIYNECRALFYQQTQGLKIIYNPQFLSGLCMAIKKNTLIEIGGFNLFYRTHAEDVDLAYKLKKQNFRFLYSPDIFVYHNRTDDYKTLRIMIYNHIYWSLVAHSKNGNNRVLKYFFAGFKVLIKQIFLCLKLKKIYLTGLCVDLFFVRNRALLFFISKKTC